MLKSLKELSKIYHGSETEKENAGSDFVFIDVEACNSYNPKNSVCQIALIRTDKNCVIKEERNFIIDPQSEYNVNKNKKCPISIGVTEEEVKNSPTFPTVYLELCSYLNNKTVIGHAVLNDVEMINHMCRRYKLDSFEFDYLCTQALYSVEIGDERQISLTEMMEACGVEFGEYKEHDARGDIKATCECLKVIIDRHNITLDDIPDFYSVKPGTLSGGVIRQTETKFTRMMRERRFTKLINKAFSPKSMSRSKVQELERLISKLDSAPNKNGVSGLFTGETVCFNKDLERYDCSEANELVKFVYKNGGRYTSSLDDTTLFIKGNRKERRYKAVQSIDNGDFIKRIKVIDQDEFLTLYENAENPEFKLSNFKGEIKMERYAWQGKLKDGCIDEYIRRHDEIWDEMKAVLKEAGITNYTVWTNGSDLFGYYECEKGLKYAAKVQSESPVVDKWNEYMSDIIVLDKDPETGAQPLLRQVFLFK